MSRFFINRPIVAIVIAIVMTFVGLITMIQLPIAQYPNIVPPEIQVRANYTGADAQTIEQSVATPIEQQMSGVDKSNYIQSVNANGSIRMTVNFDVATDPNVDHILTQLRVNQASSQLPADVINAGVTVQKSTTAPLMLVALNSPTAPTATSSSRITRTSISSTRSHACPAFRTCRSSALGSTRCASG